MTQTTYQVTFKTDDGKLAVTVTTDDPKSMKMGIGVAKRIYEEIVGQSDSEPELDTEGDAPICGIHGVPMVKQNGKHGSFWSCHQRNADGSWCSYKPER